MQYVVSGTSAYVPERAVSGERKVRVSRASVERNRAKALTVTRAYVIFLAIISAATVFMCVHYLQQKSRIKAQVRTNENLETALMSLRSENDALLENVNNTLDWNHIKDVAINELGMKYATQEQIVWYNADESSYIRQYADVP